MVDSQPLQTGLSGSSAQGERHVFQSGPAQLRAHYLLLQFGKCAVCMPVHVLKKGVLSQSECICCVFASAVRAHGNRMDVGPKKIQQQHT